VTEIKYVIIWPFRGAYLYSGGRSCLNHTVVCGCLQLCIDILESLRRGDFGKCDTVACDFKERCHELYPYALAFSTPIDNNTPDLKAKANNIDNADSANILLNGTEP